MGLFDFFKKKEQQKVTVKVSTIEKAKSDSEYSPWQQQAQPRNDNYAILAFISLCKEGATIGKTNDDYARSFSYEYKVYDPISYHKRLIAEGYLEKADVSVALEHLKVAQLKEILKSNGLPEKGKKADLLERILANVDTTSIELETYYIPSQKGWEHYKRYEYLYSVASYGIGFERYEEYKKQLNPHLKPNDIIWHILNDDFNRHNMKNDFGLARNSLYNMAQFLEKENRHKQALYYYVIVLYYDTSGLGNGGYVDEEPQYIYLAPDLVSRLVKYREHYEEDMVQQCYSRYKLPHHYIKITKFKRLVNDIFNDNLLNIKSYL